MYPFAENRKERRKKIGIDISVLRTQLDLGLESPKELKKIIFLPHFLGLINKCLGDSDPKICMFKPLR